MGNKKANILHEFVPYVVCGFAANPDQLNQIGCHVNSHKHIEFNLSIVDLDFSGTNQINHNFFLG
jgi:hypothetical protein